MSNLDDKSTKVDDKSTKVDDKSTKVDDKKIFDLIYELSETESEKVDDKKIFDLIYELPESSEKEQLNKKPKISLCPGCYPTYQPNQIAHYGPNGCIGYDDSVFEIDEEIEPKKKRCRKDKRK